MAAAYIDTLYEWSAFNTEDIGDYVGKAMVELMSAFPDIDVHLIGHSLGAQIWQVWHNSIFPDRKFRRQYLPFFKTIFVHFILWISGAAGRYYNQTTGLWIPRITGLDPANPCFNNGQVLTGLFRGDGAFVDVIHTNPGCLGQKIAIGDADFFCNGIIPLQPGCFTVTCAHGRAWKYYVETVYPGNEYNFLARACTSLVALDSKYCIGVLVPMGYAALIYIKGNYFLRTKSKKPYGENSRMYYEPVCVN